MIVLLKGRTLIVNITSEIHQYWGVSYNEVRLGISEYADQFDSVKMIVNSPGGSVTDGMAIRNEILTLVEAGIPVDVEVMGVAASIASVIALSGTSLKMRTGSYIMIHEPTTATNGNWKDLQNLSNTLKKMHDDLIDIYEGNSILSREEIEAMVTAETWFTAKEAVKNGFASKITLPEKNEVTNNSAMVPDQSMMWDSFQNVPTNLSTNMDGQEVNEPDSVKEKSMNLTDAKAAHPEIQNEVDEQIKAAKKEGGEAAAQNEATRITSLLNLAGGHMTAEVKAAIENGSSEADLALAMVKNGTAPVATTEATPAEPVAQQPTSALNNTNLVPAVDPQADLATDAQISAKADEDKFENIMSGIFPSKGEA